ncbi:MAG: TetR/AcrR family transcriptional regulator [Candidatus Hydrogenedentes bacterium]|nr:TetR/AcrR family transcriptional regulator [Candidatus Hydrogenedentota bacterium]
MHRVAAATPGRPKESGRAEARREQILKEATAAFAQHGFSSTDVQAIADTLTIGKGTVYRYFPTKRDLFLAAVDRGMRLLGECIDEAVEAQSDPLAQVEAGFRSYLAFFDAHPEVVELFVQERAAFRDREQSTYFVHKEQDIARWHSLLSEMMKSGQLRAMPVAELTDFISDHLYGMVFTNHFSGRKRTLAEQAGSALRIIHAGILPEPPSGAAPTPKGRRP